MFGLQTAAKRDTPIDLASEALDALSARLFLAVDGDHARRVGQYVELLALQMGLGLEVAHQFGTAAALHDVGKICVPDSVLQKPAPLDKAEWEIVKKHPALGASLLSGNGEFDPKPCSPDRAHAP